MSKSKTQFINQVSPARPVFPGVNKGLIPQRGPAQSEEQNRHAGSTGTHSPCAEFGHFSDLMRIALAQKFDSAEDAV